MLKKLYSLVALVLIIGLLISAWIAYSAVDEFNRKTNQDKLQAVVNLVAGELEENRTFTEIDRVVASIFDHERTFTRITIIDLSGKVIHDNEADPAVMDNHFYRPEVYRAYKEKSDGYSIRRSDTQNTEIYYYAVYRSDLALILRASIPMVAYSESLREIKEKFIVTFSIVLLTLLLIGMLSVRLLSRPLIKLEKAALKITKGEYNTRIEEVSEIPADVSRVAMAFNKMAGQLQTVIVDLEERNIQMDTILNSARMPILAVDRDLSVVFMNRTAKEEFLDHAFPENGIFPLISVVRSTEIEKRVRRALADEKNTDVLIDMDTRKGKKHMAVSVSPISTPKGQGAIIAFQDVTQVHMLQQIRSEFVANVTHELRTPLTSIRGFVDTLRRSGVKDPKVSARFLDIIDIEAERLHMLINDILILSEIEEKKEDPDIREFDLNALIDEVIVLLDEESLAKKVSLIGPENEEDATVPSLRVRANPARIKQILINIIDNAIKYNKENGKVFIHAQRNENNNEVEIVVRDTGSGISKEHLPRIFERFYRVDKSRSKQLGGTGLGLSIVKHIAMLYNGSAKAESEIGQGSTFTVRLQI
jgi:two-component system, OmpR family, phosphate regulon sensor histidine kinase PhoR